MINYPVKINDLTFAYDKEMVLNHIDLKISKGDFVSIIGPNGSGKTTLLKHIAKLIPTAKNSIWVNDVDIHDFKALDLAKTLSLVPQVNHFEYGFSAFDVVMMGRHPHVSNFKGESKKDLDVVLKAMKETDTLQFKDRAINTLSGGERQRVVLARAIAQDAQILLLDEPITYLDIHHQIDVVSLIHRHGREENKTVIAVMHDLNFALRFSDYIILLENGAVISTGSPEEVLTAHNLKVAYGIEVELIKKENKLVHIIPIY